MTCFRIESIHEINIDDENNLGLNHNYLHTCGQSSRYLFTSMIKADAFSKLNPVMK